MKKKKWVGQVFGEYAVIEEIPKSRKVRCRCSCGKECLVWKSNLVTGNSTSCHGKGVFLEKHGQYKHPAYTSWRSMINRCTNKNAADYKRYGEIGIKVCSRWLSVENFIEDMGSPPTDAHTIDRINPHKGYNKENCRWATRKEQARNKRNTLIVDGVPLSKWAEDNNIPYMTAFGRFRRGASMEEMGSNRNRRYTGQLCSKMGCDRLAKARGMCKKHYLQWWHANSKDPENIEDY